MSHQSNNTLRGGQHPTRQYVNDALLNEYVNMQVEAKQDSLQKARDEIRFAARVAALEEEKEMDKTTVTYKLYPAEHKLSNPLSLKDKKTGLGQNGYVALSLGDSLTSRGKSGQTADDSWVTVAKRDNNGRWVADDIKYQEILMLDSVDPELQKENGLKVLVHGPHERQVMKNGKYVTEGLIPCVRRMALKAYEKGADKEAEIKSLNQMLEQLEKMTIFATGATEDKNRRMTSWMAENPVEAGHLRNALAAMTSIGPDALFKPSKVRGCNTYGSSEEDMREWNQAVGTPTQSPPVHADLRVTSEEKKNKRWARGIIQTNVETGDQYCASPSSIEYSDQWKAAYERPYHHLEEFAKSKNKLKHSNGKDMLDQEAYATSSFCAQRSDQKECDSTTPSKIPLSEKSIAPSVACEFNKEQEDCQPRGMKEKNADGSKNDLYEMYHREGTDSYGKKLGFYDREQQIVRENESIRRGLTRRDRGERKRAMKDGNVSKRKLTHTRFGNAPTHTRYVTIGANEKVNSRSSRRRRQRS